MNILVDNARYKLTFKNNSLKMDNYSSKDCQYLFPALNHSNITKNKILWTMLNNVDSDYLCIDTSGNINLDVFTACFIKKINCNPSDFNLEFVSNLFIEFVNYIRKLKSAVEDYVEVIRLFGDDFDILEMDISKIPTVSYKPSEKMFESTDLISYKDRVYQFDYYENLEICTIKEVNESKSFKVELKDIKFCSHRKYEKVIAPRKNVLFIEEAKPEEFPKVCKVGNLYYIVDYYRIFITKDLITIQDCLIGERFDNIYSSIISKNITLYKYNNPVGWDYFKLDEVDVQTIITHYHKVNELDVKDFTNYLSIIANYFCLSKFGGACSNGLNGFYSYLKISGEKYFKFPYELGDLICALIGVAKSKNDMSDWSYRALTGQAFRSGSAVFSYMYRAMKAIHSIIARERYRFETIQIYNAEVFEYYKKLAFGTEEMLDTKELKNVQLRTKILDCIEFSKLKKLEELGLLDTVRI